jgi:DnaJ-class molecular chaperone
MTDHYAALGVSKTASADQIKQAFRKLASTYHPDKGGDTKKFQEIQSAYAVLGDAQKRAEYDNPRPQFSGFPGGGAQFNMNDIFSQMFGQAHGAQHPRRSHVRMSLWITLLDVVRGGRRPISVGTSDGTSTVEIDIPLGINDGDNVQYQGVAPGGQDLVIQFRVQPHAEFQREGLTLHTTHKISVWDLILGGDAEIRTIDNRHLVITIPPGCQPGTVLRLQQQGIQDRNGQKGDLMVHIHAQIPATIAPELLEAIKQYRK